MKRLGSWIIILLLSTPVLAQQNINYQLCGQDFRPLYMRSGLPKNAVYEDSSASPAARAKDVISRLSFDEKLMLTGGWKLMHYPAVPRLGLRPVYFSDASQGIHIKDLCVKVEKSTAFPSELALAATWDTALAYQYAKAIGEECRAWGISVLLGPGLNMYRNAEGGRSFEYMGEDPLLTSHMAVQYVEGLQSTGTLATIKHFIANEQEFVRHIVNVKVVERALHEIYLPPFKACIEQGGAMAVMTGNNFVNGYPGAADKPLSEGVLRKQYGFEGIIMSDWANGMFWPDRQEMELGSGQSLLMSNNKIFADYIQQEVKAHRGKQKVIEQYLDSMDYHNLYTFFKSGVYDKPYRDPSLVAKIAAHQQIALKTAEEGMVLLKNEDHILPINPSTKKRIVVIGTEEALSDYVGKGSGRVIGYNQVDYLTGLKAIYGNNIIYKKDIKDQEIKSADVVLYFINKKAGEGSDVPFDMPDIDAKIEQYAQLNQNIIIIYSGGNGLAMPWLKEVKGLIFAWLPGQEGGNALANIISGKVNPSGKLPFTIEKSFSESPAYDYNKMRDGKYYWGGGKGDVAKMKQFGPISIDYKEGIYIGYRWYDKKQIEPQFSFGFGLSYTQFKYSALSASSKQISAGKPLSVHVTITNTGHIDGAEVVQLYIHPLDPKIDRPIKALKAFQRVFLKAGESKTIQLQLSSHDLAYWSDQLHKWKVDHGKYQLLIGASSKDIRQKMTITY